MSALDLPPHPSDCIVDFLKQCLSEYHKNELFVTCDKNDEYCLDEEIGEAMCGVNIFIDSETGDEDSTINGECFEGKQSQNLIIGVHIAAIKCKYSMVLARRCLALVQREFCRCQQQHSAVMHHLRYIGYQPTTEEGDNAKQFTVLSVAFEVQYRQNMKNSKLLRQCA